jgi:hypothetical protein
VKPLAHKVGDSGDYDFGDQFHPVGRVFAFGRYQQVCHFCANDLLIYAF